MENRKKIPEIRFEGFEGEWEEERLDQLADFSKGKGYSKNDLISSGTPIVLYGKLYTDYKTTIETVNTFAKLKEDSFLSRGGEVIVPSSGETKEDIVRASVVKQKNVILGGDLNIIYPYKKLTPTFLALTISNGKVYHDLIKKAQGKSVVHIRNSDLSETYIPYSHEEEQQKIGSYFQKLDLLLSQQKQKLQKLQQLKKAMLGKLFPKAGATVPEIRFEGFEGEWEEKRLDDLVDVYDGTHQTPQYTKEGVMFLSVENIQTLQSEKFISEKAFKDEFSQYPKKGDVLMTRIGDIGTTNVVETNNPLAYYVSLALLKPKKMNPYFLKECIGSNIVKKDLWHRTLHIAFPKKINKGEIEKIMIIYPTYEEQQKIGSYFKDLDQLISKQQQQLDKLQQLKKACLAKLFV